MISSTEVDLERQEVVPEEHRAQRAWALPPRFTDSSKATGPFAAKPMPARIATNTSSAIPTPTKIATGR